MTPHRLRSFGLAALALLLVALAGSSRAQPLRLIQEVDDEDAPGAPFPPESGVQLELGQDGEAALVSPHGRRERLDPSNVSFARDAEGAARVVALDPQSGELLVLRLGTGGVTEQTLRVRELSGVAAAGVALDPARDRLFVLEASRGRVLRIDGVMHGRRRSESFELPAQLPELRGLAFDPTSGHLLALAPDAGELLEFTPEGRLVSVRALPARARGARTLAVAPSSDATDAPERHSLFVAAESAGGGSTFELALESLALAAASTVVATLVQTVNTAAFSPPSPDPSGIELIGDAGPLLIGDGEVEEMSIWAGVNLFEVSTSGSQTGNSSSTFFSDEPVGVARNPANGRIFISDDTGTRSVYEVTPGANNRIDVGDPVRQFPTAGFGANDPEGVAYGAGSLWIADGVNAEVYRLSPGANSQFDGGGDDVISHFDTQSLGVTDPEGIAYDSDGGNLYVVGEPTDRVAHISASGSLLRWIDTSAANADAPAGLAYGPGPAGSGTRRLYLVARGVDNGSNPNENDGKLYVFSLAPLTSGNQVPNVSAGPDLATDVSSPVTLAGSVGDDGLPNPPGTVTTTWSQLSGPGTISFANPNAVSTTATFSGVGSYVARLTANDSQLQASDDVSIVATSSNGNTTLERRLVAGSDDAEQGASGSVGLTSSDLELVEDGGDVQTVGLRFAGLAIPRGATIQTAWIQFQTDETGIALASLTLAGEASDDAAPFASGAGNVGARPRTAAAVAWSPSAWNMVGEAGDPQRTPDLAAVVREIVSRGGWNSGQSLAFIVTGSGSRVAESFEGSATGAALLHVEFGGSGGNLSPSVSAGPDRTISLGGAASLDGSASDDGMPDPPGVLSTSWSQLSGPGLAQFASASSVDTTATFSAAGSYVLRLLADDGAAQASDQMAVTVIDPNAAGVVEARINLGSDDAEQRVSNGSVSLTGSDLELGVDGVRIQLVGLRFPGLAIPPGAHIRSAWIQLQADETNANLASLGVQAELSASPAPFAASAFNLSSRPRTAALTWTPATWSLVGEASDAQRTPDLASLVQDAVNVPGRSLGDALVFVISGSGTRTAESFEGKATGAALLHVEYGP